MDHRRSGDIDTIKEAFDNVNDIYIADGHHRAASAVKAGMHMREKNPGYTGQEEFNYFLSVLFPHDQLMIMPYNRVVKDLNGLDKDGFMDSISQIFDVAESSTLLIQISRTGRHVY